MKKLHIVKVEDVFLIVEIINHNKYIFSKIHPKPHKTLDSAAKYVIMTNEDGVPANSMSGGNVSTFDPLLGNNRKKSGFLRRQLRTTIDPLLAGKGRQKYNIGKRIRARLSIRRRNWGK